MESTNGIGLERIVTEFTAWVTSLATRVADLKNEQDVQTLEMDLRDGGRRILLNLMQTLLQAAVNQQMEQTRICPKCEARRRHQGVRPRKLLSSFGSLTVNGIYWRCPDCGECGHAADSLLAESMSKLMQGLVSLLGVSLCSFDKAELVARRILGVPVDDNTIRRLCMKEGWVAVQQQDAPPVPVKAGEELVGSCDGTSVNTRETSWREVKAYRFEHTGGKFGGAYLEKVEQFVPRMVEAAERVGAAAAGRLLFLSDMATWIILAVAAHLPKWKHIADYWHACQHVYPAAELLYGKGDPQARKWGGYWCRRLRQYGAAVVEDKLCKLALYYTDLTDQRVVLDLAAFLRKHGQRMDYPAYEQQGCTISSGPMESFCKQIGQRMKGPGMRWAVKNVSPMASLVSRWSLDPENCSLFGAVPSAN